MTPEKGRFHGFYFSVSSIDCGWLIHSTETSPPYELELTPTKGLLVWRCFHFREQLMLLLFLLKTNWPLCRQWLVYCLLNTSCVQSLWWDLCSITVIGAASPLKSFISFEVQQLHRGRFSYAHYNGEKFSKVKKFMWVQKSFLIPEPVVFSLGSLAESLIICTWFTGLNVDRFKKLK